MESEMKSLGYEKPCLLQPNYRYTIVRGVTCIGPDSGSGDACDGTVVSDEV